MPTRAEIIGLNETREALDNVARSLHGDEMVNTMHKATSVLLSEVKKNAPVDTGRLRTSITQEVRAVNFPSRVEGVVGSNLDYALFMEEGTDHNKMPPIAALQGWARRHSTSAFLVARAILRRGGLKGRFYFKKSLDAKRDVIIKILEKHVTDSIDKS